MTARDDAAVTEPVPDAATEPVRRPGRRRDDSKDDVILQAARELLSERGYDGMTMDAVAERAGAGKSTVYRRWPSKVQLTVDSLLCSKQLTIDEVPDTGSLREDLLTIFTIASRMKNDELMSGVFTAIRDEPEVRTVFHEQFVLGRVRLTRAVLERARLRGETGPDVDLDMLAAVAPAMVHYRKVVAHLPMDAEFAQRLIDKVILPLATGSITSAPDPALVAGAR
ncbi:TetR/AcrR family transcriptional regulator [Cellulomonas hominis]|uniref:TetR/AcrR family transcriptional regulator n=1 Tax=Cellulomonas hominis TaxID=156981 RepID=UPI001B9F85E2|nr:TetR/AcrR family transcriptional regulator [Cellulomonas hominis]VTR77139.1 putative HTH-type transcriptional regulator [Cellulomonas hominis]